MFLCKIGIHCYHQLTSKLIVKRKIHGKFTEEWLVAKMADECCECGKTKVWYHAP